MKIFENKKTIFLTAILFVAVGFLFYGFPKPVSAQTGGCEVVAAKWRTNADMPSDDFTYPGNEPLVYVDIKTQNCVGQIIEITVRSYNFYGQFGLVPDPDIAVANEDPITVLQNDFTLAYKATTEGCLTDWGDWDCQFYFNLLVPGGDFDTSWYSQTELVSSSDAYYVPGAMLTYDCDDGFLGVACAASPLPWSKVMEDPDLPASENGIFPYEFSHSMDQFNSVPINVSFNLNDEDPLVNLPYTNVACENPPCSPLGNFLRGLFTILIIIAGLLAFIMIVIGGITYATTDAFSGKSAGKEMMLNAVFGLILALGAWIILNTINPNLASNLGITIPTVSISAGDADYFGPSASTDSTGTITGFSPIPESLGLVCPMNGGVASVPQVIDSFVNKTTYRWGGKGGPLPAGGQFKLSPNEQESGQATMCTNENGQSVPCRSFCPSNSVCLDCSGFVNQVRRCTGLPTFGGTSSMVANANATPVNMNNLSGNGQVLTIGNEQYTLQPGDILAWNGHTVIYYGGGLIAESAGEWTTNTNVTKKPLSSYAGKSKITHLIKVQ